MTKVIKGGTVCTADRAYKADVLIDGEIIKQIGEDLKGDEYIDAEGAYVIPGGIDPHTHLEMPFMGTTAAETFETGTWAAACGGTTMIELRHILGWGWFLAQVWFSSVSWGSFVGRSCVRVCALPPPSPVLPS